MYISPKLIKYFDENADKPKDEIIKLLMEQFNFKLSTARQRYLEYRNDIGRVNYKTIAFDFFSKNPNVLNDTESKKYAEQLDMPTSTYVCYKTQYKAIKRNKFVEVNIPKEPPKYGEKYFKGRLRQRFKIDDSNL